jgi:hypothetical protein
MGVAGYRLQVTGFRLQVSSSRFPYENYMLLYIFDLFLYRNHAPLYIFTLFLYRNGPKLYKNTVFLYRVQTLINAINLSPRLRSVSRLTLRSFDSAQDAQGLVN